MSVVRRGGEAMFIARLILVEDEARLIHAGWTDTAGYGIRSPGVSLCKMMELTPRTRRIIAQYPTCLSCMCKLDEMGDFARFM
jgi:hypothetical protein